MSSSKTKQKFMQGGLHSQKEYDARTSTGQHQQHAILNMNAYQNKSSVVQKSSSKQISSDLVAADSNAILLQKTASGAAHSSRPQEQSMVSTAKNCNLLHEVALGRQPGLDSQISLTTASPQEKTKFLKSENSQVGQHQQFGHHYENAPAPQPEQIQQRKSLLDQSEGQQQEQLCPLQQQSEMYLPSGSIQNESSLQLDQTRMASMRSSSDNRPGLQPQHQQHQSDKDLSTCNNAKRIKKSQALIQSKIVSQVQTFSQHQSQQQHQQSISSNKTSFLNNNGKTLTSQAGSHNQKATTAFVLQSSNKHGGSKHLTSGQQKIASLQSERLQLIDQGSSQAQMVVKQSTINESGSANLKSSLMVISSSGVQIKNLPDKHQHRQDPYRGSQQNSSFAPTQKMEHQQYQNMQTAKFQGSHKALQSPVKASQKMPSLAKTDLIATKNQQMEEEQKTRMESSNRDHQSGKSIKAALKPLILQKSSNATTTTKTGLPSQIYQEQQHQAQLPVKREKHSLNQQAPQQRQLKQIRNSFNNFFVTNKQQSAAAQEQQQIKLRMSQAEQRNELRNYLELASLADDTINNNDQSNSLSLYKRANPLIASEASQDRRMLSNGFEMARKDKNNSQLQALNNVNVQMMPSLQNMNGGRNQNNRTSLGPPQKGPKIHQDSFKGIYSSKMKQEKAYQSETYRMVANNTVQGPTLKTQKGGLNHKFLAGKQSPGSISQAPRQQYNDQGAAHTASLTSAFDSSQNYSGFSHLPAKFIGGGKQGTFQNSAKNQPVRARTNLDKYVASALNQKPLGGMYSAATSSVTNISNNQHQHQQQESSSIYVNSGVLNNIEQRSIDSSIHQSLQTPSKGNVSSRKLSSQFIKSNHNSAKQKIKKLNSCPYSQSPNTTIENNNPSQGQAKGGLKKGNLQLQASKKVLEPLSGISVIENEASQDSLDGRRQRQSQALAAIRPGSRQTSSHINTKNQTPKDSQQDEPISNKSYYMLPLAISKGQSQMNVDDNNSQGGLSSRRTDSNQVRLRQQKITHATDPANDQGRRASHQPLGFMQNRLSSQMAYRCYSRQKDDKSLIVSQDSRRDVANRSRQGTGISSKGRGAGQGDIGPLPRALSNNPQNKLANIAQQADLQRQQLCSQQHMETVEHNDNIESERQLIIARGGSLTRKTNMDDDEDIFNDRGGFRIKINKEQKVVNHLEDRCENNNLLFYNFNAYKCESKSRGYGGEGGNSSVKRHEEAASNYEPTPGKRPYSRTSMQTKSRQDFRQRQIQSAASTQSRKSRHGHPSQAPEQSLEGLDQEVQMMIMRGQDNVESCGSLETQINPLDPNTVLMSSTVMHDGSASAQNRYKMANENPNPQNSKQRQIEIVHNTNLAANITSSGSLTTAETTKASDFGNHGIKGSNFGIGSTTPQRDSQCAINDVNVQPRPTNSSRVFGDQSSSGDPASHRINARQELQRKARGHQGEDADGRGANKGLIPSQYSIIKASQTSIGSNSFARSAMRLKQKSGRNGLPNRGGSLDGSCNNQQMSAPSTPEDSGMSRAGRTAGGAVWSRMLNMQSVEEGIQEGNISSEDD